MPQELPPCAGSRYRRVEHPTEHTNGPPHRLNLRQLDVHPTTAVLQFPRQLRSSGGTERGLGRSVFTTSVYVNTRGANTLPPEPH